MTRRQLTQREQHERLLQANGDAIEKHIAAVAEANRTIDQLAPAAAGGDEEAEMQIREITAVKVRLQQERDVLDHERQLLVERMG